MQEVNPSNLTQTFAYEEWLHTSSEFRSLVPVYLIHRTMADLHLTSRGARLMLRLSFRPHSSRAAHRKMRKLTHRLMKRANGNTCTAMHLLLIEARRWYDKAYPGNIYWVRRRKRLYNRYGDRIG